MSKSCFSKLFEVGRIGKILLKNRIIKTATLSNYANPDGSVSERLIRFYEEVAKGGAALVLVEMAYIDEKGSKLHHNQVGINDDAFKSGWALLAQRIQENGAKAGLQLCHAGFLRKIGPPVMTPSPLSESILKNLNITGSLTQLSIGEIIEIEESLGKCALTAKQVGFDLIEIHAAHGYLITQFLSPLINKRTDLYGGSDENRMRFLLEIINNVRNKVGPDYPISVRLNGSEYTDGGMTIADTITIAKALEKAKVDLINISGGSRYTRDDTIVVPGYHPDAFNVWAADAVKKAINIPIAVAGAISTPELAEKVLSEGKADFIGMGRPLIADPYLPRKAKEGRVDDIVPCIRCDDGCLRSERRGFGGIRCTVNVAVGKEEKFKIEPANQAKRVAIVGGGPAGMEAARVATLMGHKVTLFEKRELGGLLIEAGVPEFKNGVKRLARYYKTQMSKFNIDIVKKEAGIRDLIKANFDVVILATGSIPSLLQIPGSNKPFVMSAIDMLNGKNVIGDHVIVIGGGSVGCDVALYLAEKGKNVFILEMFADIGRDMEKLEKQSLLERIKGKNIQIYTGAKVKEITNEGVLYTSIDDRSTNLKADTVILATGSIPQDLTNIEELSKEVELIKIGDCITPEEYSMQFMKAI